MIDIIVPYFTGNTLRLYCKDKQDSVVEGNN